MASPSSTPPPSFYESLLATSGSDVKIRASAAVVPWRRQPDGRIEVYWVRRSPTMRFMGGWWAFPGGGVARSDAAVEERFGADALRRAVRGVDPESPTHAAPGLSAESMEDLGPDLAPGVVAATLRELFEETGLLLVDGAPPTDVLAARRRLLAKEVDFGDLLGALDRRPDASALVAAGRWLTPPFAPMRFDNRFFLLEWAADRPVQPSLEGGELDRGEWIEPHAALGRWFDGEVMTAPPILHLLRVLGDLGSSDDRLEEGLRRLRDPHEADLGPMRKIEFRPGVVLMPLRTPTLLPATHTNAFLLGRRESVIVDPATPFPDEQQRLLAALDAAVEQGHELRAIWLTHHHSDHIGAVDVVRERYDLPVLAHPATAERLAGRIDVDGRLTDGQEVVLDGDPALPITIHHTPGHAPGHLCFFDRRSKTLIAGDLVSTLSTIIVDPSEGDMDDYLGSLDRMAALEPQVLFPSHGPGSLDAVAKLREFHSHRLEREAKVLTAYREGKTTPSAMVAEVYADVPPFVHPIAERQIQAHLDRLAKLGEL
ncbi:MAG: MBL fold metallo-hydrolase, partial [Acidobacteriota bacterium]